MSAPPAVELRGVEVRFGARTALHGLDLVVHAGERVALIGPSGAGKSTLIGLLNGTVPPTAGTVRVLGADPTQRATRRRVGTVHQRFDLVGELRVVHNVNAGRLAEWSLWRSLCSLVAPREVDVARAALDRVGLADRIGQRTSSLSGGEQQRVAIARVLVQEPELLLADEPVASLDPARGAEIVGVLHDVAGAGGATLLAGLHDVELALGPRFERVLGLRDGRLVLDAPSARVDRTAVDALYTLAAPDPSEPGRRDEDRVRRGRSGC